MSEQERYGQEAYEPREPYAPYPPGHPAATQQGQGYAPYPGQQGQHQGYGQGHGASQGQQQGQGYDTGAQPVYDPAYYQQGYAQQPYPARPASPGYDADTGGWQQQTAHPGQEQPGTAYQDPYAAQRHPGYQQPYPGAVPQQHAPYARPGTDTGEFPAQDTGEFPAAHEAGDAAGEEHAGEDEFHTEQFAFVEEEDEQAEDVIDWLKFSESRSERRDERKRRGRTRTIALAVAVALALGGGGTYAWKAGLIPGIGAASPTSLAAQKRDVIVVHLRLVNSKDSSTLLLVRNETTGRATTVLLPNNLLISDDGDQAEPLGTSVVKDGAGPTRDGLSTLFGANIQATWRLDTPFLEILVDSVGGILMNTNATIDQGGKPLVTAGNDQSLNGRAAVAYATYRAPGEPASAQLERFGAVMRAVLMQVPSSAPAATKMIDQMGAVLDPSLTEAQLGASLAALSDLVKSGHYTTSTLPVQRDGTLSQQATDAIVHQVLGGTVRNTDTSGVPTVSVRDATTDPKAADAAQAQVVDSGNTYVDGGKQAPRTTSQVIYGAASQKSAALQLATTLGLPAADVVHGTGAANADLTVVLGADYHPPTSTQG